MFWLRSQFPILLLHTGRVSWRLVLISTTLADPLSPPLVSRSWTVGLTRGARLQTATNVFDGKIYVAGGCKGRNSSTWMEVFDPKTQAWEHVFGPLADRCIREVYKSAMIDGEMYVFGHNRGVAYKLKEAKWEALGAMTCLDLGWVWLSYCVIDNILYCYHKRDGIKWYDSKIGRWINLMGLKGLPKFDYSRVKLADYGGKLVVLWGKYLPSGGYQNMMIWCAVISLERRSIQEMCGKVEWLDAVLTVPKSYNFVCALSATV